MVGNWSRIKYTIIKGEVFMKKILRSLLSSVTATVLAVASLSVTSAFASYEDHIFSNFPCYQQMAGSTDCWAQSIRAMYKYEYNTSISIEAVIGTYVMLVRAGTGNTTYNYSSTSVYGAIPIYVYQTFAYYFPSYDVSYYVGVLTQNEIISQYSNDLMALVIFRSDISPTSWIYHVCAFAGYRSGATSSNVQRVYYMNPTTGQIERGSYYANSYIYLRDNDVVNAYNYYWYETMKTDIS